MMLNGNFHLHFYPCLARYIRELRPDVFHIDEEPYNFATFHAILLARRAGVKTVFFTWQNLLRRYPLPFRLIERYNLSVSDYGIAGSVGAMEVLRQKGYRRPVAVIPQVGVDPHIYSPDGSVARSGSFVIGYVGRLYEMKGLVSLVEAFAGLPSDAELHIIGEGPFRSGLEDLARKLGVFDRTVFVPYTPSPEMPQRLREFDVLVLPSLTTPNWKEQFGRVLVEAMACEVPVVGSDSGEIPHVIGDAGLIFPEGQEADLCQRLVMLMEDRDLRVKLGKLGRERVLARYTQARIAEDTYGVYRQMAGS
jgi:glycosyltransferase involved in cell wall biosynthesis